MSEKITKRCTNVQDKNGNLINEDDIVEISLYNEVETMKFAVKWDKTKETFSFVNFFRDRTYKINDFYSEDLEIIGNVNEDNDIEW